MTSPDAVSTGDLRHRRIDVGAVHLHVVEAGPEDGPLAILLHGFPELWYGWHRQISPLAEAGFRVLVPDQRGYNRSDKPRSVGSYRLDRLADDIKGLIRAVGRESACVAGHDWGAVVAWWLGITTPETIDRLAILNVPHPAVMRKHLRSNWAQMRRSWYIFYFQLPFLPERGFSKNHWEMGVKTLLSTSRKGTFRRQDLEVYKRAWGQDGGSIRTMIHWYRAALRRPVRNPPSFRVTVPTKILWGEQDRFLGKEMVEPSLALCDQAEVQWFPEATHWVQHEEPDEVSRSLIEHFQGDRGTSQET